MNEQEQPPDFFADGNEHLRTGQYVEAVKSFEKFIELMPESPEGHNNLGLAVFHNGDLDRATREFQVALDLSPDFAAAQANLGLALLNKKNFEEAIGPLRRALQLDAGITEAYYNLGLALYRSGRTAEAIEAYERFVANAPAEHKNYAEGVEKILKQLKQTTPAQS